MSNIVWFHVYTDDPLASLYLHTNRFSGSFGNLRSFETKAANLQFLSTENSFGLRISCAFAL